MRNISIKVIVKAKIANLEFHEIDININKLLESKDNFNIDNFTVNALESIDYLLVYFKSFWSGKIIDTKDESRLPSNFNISYNNEKKFAKNSELSYKYFFRNIFKDRIKF